MLLQNTYLILTDAYRAGTEDAKKILSNDGACPICDQVLSKRSVINSSYNIFYVFVQATFLLSCVSLWFNDAIVPKHHLMTISHYIFSPNENLISPFNMLLRILYQFSNLRLLILPPSWCIRHNFKNYLSHLLGTIVFNFSYIIG